MVPAVFVGLGTWKRMYPETRVLNLSTVRAKPWFYTNEDLARGRVTAQGKLLTLGVGLRNGGDTLVVGMPLVQEKKILEVEVGEVPLAVVWHDDEKAAFVYERRVGDATLELELRDDELRERGGERRWDPVTAERTDGEGEAVKSPIGYLPGEKGLDLSGLKLSSMTLSALFEIDRNEWLGEVKEMREYLSQFGQRLPQEIIAELNALEQRFNSS